MVKEAGAENDGIIPEDKEDIITLVDDEGAEEEHDKDSTPVNDDNAIMMEIEEGSGGGEVGPGTSGGKKTSEVCYDFRSDLNVGLEK